MDTAKSAGIAVLPGVRAHRGGALAIDG